VVISDISVHQCAITVFHFYRPSLLKEEQSLQSSLRRFWDEHPLRAILLIAVLPRLAAALFSKGYGMHDDHFGPIEQPFIIMQYLTYWTGRTIPHGHSIVYPSLHYLLFNALEFVGIRDPQAKMYVVRFLHAAYSLLIVYYGYKIAKALSDRTTARKAGLVLALFWPLPFLGVRNLIEVICIPPLMAGMYYALTSRSNLRNAFIAGLWLGLAFVFRYQTLLITGTVGLVFLFRKEFRHTSWCAIGFLLSVFVVQGSADIFAWGYPFASFIEYVRYNMAHGEDYTTGPWYNYILLVFGTLLPPLSALLIYGFFKYWRKAAIIVFPVLVFFVLHSYFPNKQERFILPVVPLILVLGVVGLEESIRKSAYWLRHARMLKSFWVAFWVLNLILLVPFSLYYGKRSRVEAMYELYGKPLEGVVLVGGKVGTSQPPLFYTGKYPVNYYEVNSDDQLVSLKSELGESKVRITHVVFFGTEQLDDRIGNIGRELGLTLRLERRTDPSFLDVVFYRLNPKHNKNEITFVYSALAP
jgi:hypothetical protein